MCFNLHLLSLDTETHTGTLYTNAVNLHLRLDTATHTGVHYTQKQSTCTSASPRSSSRMEENAALGLAAPFTSNEK